MARSMTSNNDEEYAKDDESNPSFDDEGDEGRDQVKKGPWTPEEDMILMEYVKRNGEGNWNSVQKNSGLSRCGKSCRLRWANHLRPNLKKGAFSEDEEKVIVELHAKIGNKWARMASQLPGRTDNEIKNFWNTRLKRRQRAGLPIYPPEVNTESHAFKYQIEQCKLKNPSTSPTFSKLLKACYKNNPESANCTPNPGNSYPPISPYNPSPSPSTLFNQNFVPPQNNNNSGNMNMNYDHDHDFGIGSVYEPAPLMPAADSVTDQISSNETQTPHDSATPDSSYPSPVDGLMGATSTMVNNNDQYYEVAPRLSSEGSNTGLLHDLVMEARNLSRTNDMSKSDQNSTANGKVSRKRKSVEDEEEHVEVAAVKKKSTGDKANETMEDFNSGGKKAVEEDPWAEMNFEMDDDLFSLINDFPSGMPMPEWYRSGESDPLGLETQNDNAAAATTAANPSASSVPNNQELAWTLGSCWNNMPGIC